MTVTELRDKCNELIEKSCGDYEVYTLFKNCTRCREIDRASETVTFA